MAFQDQNLSCRDCGNQFVWTASEQEFYQSKGFQNAPVRCPSCRQAKKARMDGGGSRGGGGGGSRQMYEITCSNCGKTDQVPFQPRGDRPVLCGDCFRKQKEGGLPESGGSNNDQNVSEEGPVEASQEESPKEDSKEEQPQAE